MTSNTIQANRVAHWRSILKALLAATVLSVVLAETSLAQAPTKCDPTKSCCREETIGGDPGLKCVGNPIDVVTGNKYQREEDLPALPGVLGLEIVRHYNSAYSRAKDRNGLLGRGWRLSYEIDLVDAGSSITIVQADGRPIVFTKGLLEPRVYTAADPAQGRVTIEGDATRRVYLWRQLSGRQLMFDQFRRLVSVRAPSGEFASLLYDPDGSLMRVTDPQGRHLDLQYLDKQSARSGKQFRGVRWIDTPVGRFEYEHGQAASGAQGDERAVVSTLVKVTSPAGDGQRNAQHISRLYHYEDKRFPTLLTGISVQGAGPDGKPLTERISTYGYDAQGRGILTVRGVPARYKAGPDGKPLATPEPGTGLEQVTLDFSELGQTVATNSLGQRTVFTYRVIAGQERLVEARGTGCAHCPGPNERYGYDKFGRMNETTKLTPVGEPLQTLRAELDDLGRPRHIERIDYLQGKPQPANLLARYEYGAWPQPRLIARPSVVPGKEHVIRVRFNDLGQPLQVTEEGFSPLDDNGQPGVSPIQRSVTYGYSIINGRSLQTEIDGPLPNGPKGSPEDSDITRIEYDRGGNFVTAVTQPMNLRRSFVRDLDSGRLVADIGPDGIATNYQYGAGVVGPSTVERAGRTLHIAYDPTGRIAGISDAPGRGMQLRYDSAARLVSVMDAQGYKAQTTLDSEGQALVSGLYEPGQDKPLRATYRWFDEQHRLVQQLRADGRVDAWQFAPDGRWVRHDDGNQVLNLHGLAQAQPISVSLASDGQVRATLGQAEESVSDAVAADTPASRRDDFGRTVASWLPGQGLRQWRFDAANHMLAQTALDRTMKPAHTMRWQYDAAGRLTERVHTDAQGKAALTLRLRYDGARLVEEADDAQVRRLEYDAAGRVVRTVLEIKDAQGRTAYATTLAASFDAASGELHTRTLADGRVMLVARTSDSQVARSIALQTPFWFAMSQRVERWLPSSWVATVQGWLPGQVIVADIGFHPFNGITGFTQGNGVQTRKSFDIAGRLTGLNAAGARPVLAQTLRYGVGPRIASVEDAASAFKGQFQYTGFGELKLEVPQLPAPQKTSQSAPPIAPRTAALPRVEFDSLGRVAGDGTYRYTYTVTGQIATVSRPDGAPVASYRYNASGQRVSKTLASGQVSYYLWQDGRLVAEIIAGQQGAEVIAQYLYLGDQGLAAPVAKLEGEHAEGNATAQARVLYIHANHRAEPVAMTDSRQAVVWRAQPDEWGFVKASTQQQSAVLNLRLPGQYFDAETGLHDNWHRSYDPRPDSPWRGRYLSPDPLGYADGPDPYRYVNGDPVNKVDPTGLYESDIHYYMTYFLAITAGVDPDRARTIALATQYVDNNPATQPINEVGGKPDYAGSLLTNELRVKRYHFVLSESGYGKVLGEFLNPGFENLDNAPQLKNLIGASIRAERQCAKDQFFGEYLHAFEDTFSHRDPDNMPIDATWTLVTGDVIGLGHGFYAHEPDFTYNHLSTDLRLCPLALPGCLARWYNNEYRTLMMEEQVFAKLQKIAEPGKGVAFAKIRAVVNDFNAIHENDDNTDDYGSKKGAKKKIGESAKIQLLNKALRDLGFTGIDLTDKDKQGYNVATATENREKNLCDKIGMRLKEADYPGTILPTSKCPK